MITLSREIRFALPPSDQITSRSDANTWAAWPASDLLVPHLILRCALRGNADPVTGYLCNIKVIDDMLQQIVIGQIIPDYWSSSQGLSASATLASVFQFAQTQWQRLPGSNGKIVSIELEVSPFLRFAIYLEAPDMIQLTQQFEFSAAHRLHCPQLTDEENRRVFGKCNHPAGHGHNYVVEVTVDQNIDQRLISFLESTVKRVVINRLDHKHLNEDLDYFQEINPSVENISKAIFDWLKPELIPFRLRRVRVYETPKTWAECDLL